MGRILGARGGLFADCSQHLGIRNLVGALPSYKSRGECCKQIKEQYSRRRTKLIKNKGGLLTPRGIMNNAMQRSDWKG